MMGEAHANKAIGILFYYPGNQEGESSDKHNVPSVNDTPSFSLWTRNIINTTQL